MSTTAFRTIPAPRTHVAPRPGNAAAVACAASYQIVKTWIAPALRMSPAGTVKAMVRRNSMATEAVEVTITRTSNDGFNGMSVSGRLADGTYFSASAGLVEAIEAR